MPSLDSNSAACQTREHQQKELFNASFDRCLHLNDGDVKFVNYFCGILKGRDQNISNLFEAFPVHHQIHTLRTALYLLVDHQNNEMPSSEFIEFVSSHRNFRGKLRPYMLDIWLECLLETVAECDPLYSESIRAAWRAKFKPTTILLKSALENAESPAETFTFFKKKTDISEKSTNSSTIEEREK